MQSKAKTPEEYMESLPEERKAPMARLREEIAKNIPDGFDERMSYGMLGWVVPHEMYPAGYHCNPKDPLPFINLASQKNYISVYHMGLYSETAVYKWFVEEYAKRVSGKLDMGKCCIRFKKMESIPYGLIGELASKMTPEDWIDYYERAAKDSRKRS